MRKRRILGVLLIIFSFATIVFSQNFILNSLENFDNLFFTGPSFFQDEVTIYGTIFSGFVKIVDTISFTDGNFNDLYNIFIAGVPLDNDIPAVFDNTLVISGTNSVIFWDNIGERPIIVIGDDADGRATTTDRSLQVGKSLGVAPLDVNYTRCQNTVLADCNTSGTGADLVVEDDIENFGSIKVHENATIDGNLSFKAAFGELFQNEKGTVVAITDVNKFVQLDGFDVGSSSNTLVDDMNITVQFAGVYSVTYAISISNEAKPYTSAIMIDGVAQTAGSSSSSIGKMSASTQIDLNANNRVSLALENQVDTTDVTIESATFTLVYSGR